MTLFTIEKIKAFFSNNDIQINDYICNKCRVKISQNNLSVIENNDEDSLNESVHELFSDVLTNNKPKPIKYNEKAKGIVLDIAMASHSHCLLCKQKTGLHKVKAESILCAYQNFGVIIKYDSRCCKAHLDEEGLIKMDEFFKLKNKSQYFDKNIINLLDYIILHSEKKQIELTDTCGVFDKFRNMPELDENLCLKITGWSRTEFDRFSQNITSIKDTAGRTKEELIAIYRYWLLKGLDQSTLSLLKCNTTQQQISHFLAQIREALNKDIVTKFLGAKMGKEFFLNHNTTSVKILHDFKDETLAVIVDGTYTRLEKSANNDFQYLSYSVQKLDNLVKPFIICCADGYFIDCYGPFQANLNDAKIFRHILDTDKHLQDLFTPKEDIMIFLDRGNYDNMTILLTCPFKCFYIL